ncbi:hypothetical protein [Novosphingobium sp. M1R2S20]|uniref:Threonine/homoserine/homoserine lactone efflux protein n=1 Tax=Novosphingobium rhizovicinum TaxID=3228928 RepID=A0ABV3R6Z4_9SPHN
MMDQAVFLAAILALLCAPGPTNTLVALAGAQGGMRRVLGLLPAEVAGYLTAILPLVLAGDALFMRWPALVVAIKAAAAAWVLLLAAKLWRTGTLRHDTLAVSARRIYLTTSLNPKALVVAFALLPSPSTKLFAYQLLLFCAVVPAVGLGWGALGATLQDRSRSRMPLIHRAAALWLTAVSCSLAANAFSA